MLRHAQMHFSSKYHHEINVANHDVRIMPCTVTWSHTQLNLQVFKTECFLLDWSSLLCFILCFFFPATPKKHPPCFRFYKENNVDIWGSNDNKETTQSLQNQSVNQSICTSLDPMQMFLSLYNPFSKLKAEAWTAHSSDPSICPTVRLSVTSL